MKTSVVDVALAGLFVLLGAAALAGEGPETPPYDPLALPAQGGLKPADLTVRDEARRREIPIRVYLPADKAPAPVVLFSHGLGGTRDGCTYLGKHWSARGYVVVFLQHPGSDDSVWKDEPAARRMAAMQRAASGRNFMLRVRDVPAVLDQLAAWNRDETHPLANRMHLSRVGMSGHSFGAVTTQAVSGQAFAGRTLLTDPRIRAAIAFSPSNPRRGDPATAFGSVKIPWMLMTGTKDVAAIGNTDLASRLAVYPALPGEKYELVLHDGQHSAFTDRALPGETGKRNPNHHRAILALSTAFWDLHLRELEPAGAWLQGDGPRAALEEKDRWQFKAPSEKKQPITGGGVSSGRRVAPTVASRSE
jgi:predicted dienelactone hydrolase